MRVVREDLHSIYDSPIKYAIISKHDGFVVPKGSLARLPMYKYEPYKRCDVKKRCKRIAYRELDLPRIPLPETKKLPKLF